MKPVYLALVLALSVPGCSRFTKSGRMDRAYYKQLAQVKAQREKHRKDLAKRQRAQQAPPKQDELPPLQMQSVQTTADTQ